MSLTPNEIKKRTIDLGITYREIAEQMGVSVTYVADLIHGRRQNEERLKELYSILEFDEGTEFND